MRKRKMDFKKQIIIVTVLVGFHAGNLYATGPVYNPANGHSYEAISVQGGISWDSANNIAKSHSYLSAQGYLATITSQAESDFIINNLGGAVLAGFWLGGFQPNGSPEPDGNWQWITGEAWNYINWAECEPNNAYGTYHCGPVGAGAPEQCLQFHPDPTYPGWNDTKCDVSFTGFVVEYDDGIYPTTPVAEAGPDQIIDQTSEAGAEVVLDGSASTDDGLPEPLTYTWSWDGGSATGVSLTVTLPVGTTQVTLTVFDGQWYDQDTVNIKVRDTVNPDIWCVESVNPSGKNVPKSKNPDGFYQIFTSDAGGAAPLFWVGTADNPIMFGPGYSGIYVKLTEAQGAEPSAKTIGNSSNAMIFHVTLPSDAVFTAVDSAGNTSTCKCLVAPPPK